jgi:hypothetical protein
MVKRLYVPTLGDFNGTVCQLQWDVVYGVVQVVDKFLPSMRMYQDVHRDRKHFSKV